MHPPLGGSIGFHPMHHCLAFGQFNDASFFFVFVDSVQARFFTRRACNLNADRSGKALTSATLLALARRVAPELCHREANANATL